MTYKFEKLEIYQLSLDYLDLVYNVAEKLPRAEEYNLRPQTIRAGTSIVLNIAEGSTTQSNPEQARFLGMALRSLIETVACHHIMKRRKFADSRDLSNMYEFSQKLFAKIQAMIRALNRENQD
jgi:four helix bundle protein